MVTGVARIQHMKKIEVGKVLIFSGALALAGGADPVLKLEKMSKVESSNGVFPEVAKAPTVIGIHNVPARVADGGGKRVNLIGIVVKVGAVETCVPSGDSAELAKQSLAVGAVDGESRKAMEVTVWGAHCNDGFEEGKAYVFREVYLKESKDGTSISGSVQPTGGVTTTVLATARNELELAWKAKELAPMVCLTKNLMDKFEAPARGTARMILDALSDAKESGEDFSKVYYAVFEVNGVKLRNKGGELTKLVYDACAKVPNCPYKVPCPIHGKGPSRSVMTLFIKFQDGTGSVTVNVRGPDAEVVAGMGATDAQELDDGEHRGALYKKLEDNVRGKAFGMNVRVSKKEDGDVEIVGRKVSRVLKSGVVRTSDDVESPTLAERRAKRQNVRAGLDLE